MRRIFAASAASALTILGLAAPATAAQAAPQACTPSYNINSDGLPTFSDGHNSTVSPYDLYFNGNGTDVYCTTSNSHGNVMDDTSLGSKCVALNSTTRTIYAEAACSNTWDAWQFHVNSFLGGYTIESVYNSACIQVDHTFAKATYNPCNTHDIQEDFFFIGP